jgi:segregation and condensation protein B
MSLKAKLEAVIYAAEEPVTLAQLSTLFAYEALEWKAEQAALAAAERPTEDSLGTGLDGELEPDGPESDEAEPGESGTVDVALVELGLEDADPVEAAELPVAEVGTDAVALGDLKPVVAAAATPDPELEAKRLARLREKEVREILRGLLDELLAEYASAPRGIEIREIAGGYRMATKPECHDAVRSFVKSLKPPMKLSLPALETLAVIAYKQPVTSPEVGEIRGVDSAGVLGSLISRKLITTAGRKQVVGRPMLYKTTKEFLLRFGLKDVSELPSMEEFEKMAAIELSEVDEEDAAQAPIESGDLFADSEAAGESEIGTAESKEEIDPREVEQLENQAVPTPTAEPSEEAAAAHAPVARQDAEENEEDSNDEVEERAGTRFR